MTSQNNKAQMKNSKISVNDLPVHTKTNISAILLTLINQKFFL